MIPDPLHPAIVHFPIVLAVLLPIFALGALWAIRRGADPRWAWAMPLALAAAMALSGWVAVEAGEDQEERVESVVGENALHEHEEGGERFLVLTAVVLLVAGAGLLGGTVGAAGRYLATAGSLVALWAGVSVGSSGGELVYRHGAAAAYISAPSAVAPAAAPQRGYVSEEDER
jgi:uncharacterized membrane protein